MIKHTHFQITYLLIVKKFIKYWEKGFIYIPMTTPLKVTLLIFTCFFSYNKI